MRRLLIAVAWLLACLSAAPKVAWAQAGTPAQALTACGSPNNGPVNGSYYSITTDLKSQLCINGSTTPSSSSVTGSVSAATIGASSAQVLAAAPRRLLAIDNESASATIACAFGTTAGINTAGSFTIPPGVTRVWSSYPVPADAVNCIASAASTPATVEAN